MIYPIVHFVVSKTIGKHLVIRASARRHLGGAVKLTKRLRLGITTSKNHQPYISYMSKNFYWRRKL